MNKLGRLVTVCLLLLLVVLPIFASCAAPKSTPTSATPKSTPTTVAPKPTPTPTPTAKPRFYIEMLTGPIGGGAYYQGFALAHIINKYSTWLTATCIETTGTTENLKKAAIYPEKRAFTLYQGKDVLVPLLQKGMAPFEEKNKYSGLRAIGCVGNIAIPLYTQNLAIRTLADLQGKKVATQVRGGEAATTYDMIFKANDIKADVQLLNWGPARDALLDGRIDAAATGIGPFDPRWDEWTMTEDPSVALTISKKPIYLVDVTKEAIEKTTKYFDLKYTALAVPVAVLAASSKAGMLRARDGQPVIYGYQSAGIFYADVSMSPDVVYEIVKCWYEHDSELWEYGGATCKRMRKDLMTNVVLDKAGYHPGAVKFYEEVKLPLGPG